MWKDPIVEEVRKHREAHAATFDYDVAAICQDLRKQQEESGRQVVGLSTRKIGSAEEARPSKSPEEMAKAG